MGLLTPVQKILAPDVWDPSQRLWPHIRTHILQKLFSIVPIENVKELYLIGSTTGYQWSDTSDMDINVSLAPKELVEDPALILKRKHINGFLAQGTRHPVNFFWVAYQDKPQFWGDSIFGVYDILNDTWVASPGLAKDQRDPNKEYYLDLITAKFIRRKFEDMVDRWLLDIQTFKLVESHKNPSIDLEYDWHLSRIINKLQYDFQELVEFCHEWDRNRKFIYSWGYGIPRKSWQNITFKILGESKYSNYFEFFKELNTDDLISVMADAIKL